jgi:hypothetical protein
MIFKRLLSRKSKPKRIKLSEMIIKYAGDYIQMGEDIEEKQEFLNGAVSAWNIACLKENDREKAIRRYMKEFRPEFLD